MEILNFYEVQADTFGFYLIGTLIIMLISYVSFKVAEKMRHYTFAIACLIIAVMIFITGLVTQKDMRYEVIVHDWNEIYEQGFSVVSQKGSIVTLRKEKIDDYNTPN